MGHNHDRPSPPPDPPPRVNVVGRWPGRVRLRRGWAAASARPWNCKYEDAQLRLERGGAVFLTAAAQMLLHLGAPSVLSPPLPASAQRVWRSAGFQALAELDLLRLDLEPKPNAPAHLVVAGSRDNLTEMVRVDQEAFAPFWALDEVGLNEAIAATARAEILIINSGDGGLAGFAILGYGSALAYLQRVTVSPPWQGQGMGRSLIRAAARRARAAGSRSLLLNTQRDNERALGLYESEGYQRSQGPLELLRWEA